LIFRKYAKKKEICLTFHSTNPIRLDIKHREGSSSNCYHWATCEKIIFDIL